MHGTIYICVNYEGVLSPFYMVCLCVCMCNSCFFKSLLCCLQLYSLQKDNMRLRGELERELALRQNLEMQLQTRDQTISGLRTQLDARTFSRIDTSPSIADPDRLVRDNS